MGNFPTVSESRERGWLKRMDIQRVPSWQCYKRLTTERAEKLETVESTAEREKIEIVKKYKTIPEDGKKTAKVTNHQPSMYWHAEKIPI